MVTQVGYGVSSLFSTILAGLIAFESVNFALGQSLSTNMPVPPLQWLNLSALISGSSPPPLMYSSIGYDETTRSVVIFGGESQAGVPQQQTYLLNTDALLWSVPTPLVTSRNSRPPARSRALGTGDFAANSRRDFIIFGGKSDNNEALGDVWAYDYLYQFWTPVNIIGSGPSPRWGASGGIDPANEPNSGNNVSNIMHVAGGTDSSNVFPSTQLYELLITGTIASDVVDVQGVWKSVSNSTQFPGNVDGGGTLISQTQSTNARVVISGGCGSDTNPSSAANTSCINPSTYVVTVGSLSAFSPGQCPAPRLGPTLVPNLNPSSTAFASQVFMLLGNIDHSAWDDNDGLSDGEVAILDVNTGTWSRILPAGDPKSTHPFPAPREGAAALSLPTGLFGSNRAAVSDTIIFGGRDPNGTYMNDIWILRSYNATLSHSNDTWSGFGKGSLGTGVDASGAGVTVQYLSTCARALKATPSTSSAGKPSPTSGESPEISHSPKNFDFDVSMPHKVLPPVSLAVILGAIVMLRYASTPAPTSQPLHPVSWYLANSGLVVAYAIGVAGFATSFSSLTRNTTNSQKRDASFLPFLPTGHARGGFALFILLYLVCPLLFLRSLLRNHKRKRNNEGHGKEAEEMGLALPEKDTPGTTPGSERPPSPSQSAPEIHSRESSLPNRRLRTFSGSLLSHWRGPSSSENLNHQDSPPSKGFEVVNRPRRTSAAAALYPPRDPIRSINDLSWLERRRSVSAVGELDYALSQMGHSPRSVSPPYNSRPPTVAFSNRPFVRTPTPPHTSRQYIGRWDIFLHIFFHALLLANCALALVALFDRAPIATFAVFLVWTIGSYLCIFILAWNGRPARSILTTLLYRLRTHPAPPSQHPMETPTVEENDHVHNDHLQVPQSPVAGPYYQQPPWRRAVSPDRLTRTSYGRPTPELDEVDDDDDLDESDRQRRMEEELERRDVHIITVPRKKLWVANPG